jgi:uncharacterized membrane protein affecting hemolysin expression
MQNFFMFWVYLFTGIFKIAFIVVRSVVLFFFSLLMAIVMFGAVAFKMKEEDKNKPKGD